MVVSEDKVTLEVALNKAGFGLYSYLIASLSGLVIISVACIAYGTTIIIPTSACELKTTTAQRGILAATPLVGLIIGAILWGYLTDVFGRRFTLLISLLSSATVNALASLSVNWVMLMILQFTATLLASGQYSQAMTILSESVPMAKRNIVVILVGSIFLLAQGIMAVLAIPIIPLTFSYELPSLGIYWNSWRTLLLVYSAPSIISAIWLYFMCESPKFLYSKGRNIEALDVLKKIYRLNHLGKKEEFEPDAVPCSLNVTSLLMVLGVGAMQSVVNALISLVVDRFGRRNMVMFVTSLCGVCGVLVNLIPNAITSAVMFMVFLNGIVTYGLYTAISVALFPTYLRATAVAFTMTGTRIASFASIQILNALLETNCEGGFYVYSVLFACKDAFILNCFYFLTPDAKRRVL
ncbi:unnamed protein product, partial [Brenthis ino]